MHTIALILIAAQRENLDDGPDLIIAADTVVFTHATGPMSDVHHSLLPTFTQDLLEKPIDREDNMRMLMDLNGGVCEVVTGVSLGQQLICARREALKDLQCTRSWV